MVSYFGHASGSTYLGGHILRAKTVYIAYATKYHFANDSQFVIVFRVFVDEIFA